MADHFQHLDLCPSCDGLRVLRGTRLEGVTVDLDAGPWSFRGKTTLTITPLPEACPNTTPEVNRG
ncbi:hypothetical protein [Streptomyces sp. NPDC006334]|uniref:hypothetical protein n=1 Tax=Streptomyces sp. NPDC006334 TaxID=3156754 RepID=UPI0033B35A34